MSHLRDPAKWPAWSAEPTFTAPARPTLGTRLVLAVGWALLALARLAGLVRGFLPLVLAWYAGWRLLEWWFRP